MTKKPTIEFDPQRSAIMRAVPRANSVPEIAVRATLHGLGLRFRLHRRDLPGTPDIVLARHRTVIFVHGCFWHRHPNCKKTTTPKNRSEFWAEKFQRNIERDARNEALLIAYGWRVLTIWECQTTDNRVLRGYLRKQFPRRQTASAFRGAIYARAVVASQ
jgi:DNA mismatch endonuclease (patch repair protein)